MPTCEYCARMWEIILCGQTVGGTAMSWGLLWPGVFLKHSLLFLVLEPVLLPLPLHRTSQLLGYGFALTFVKEKKMQFLHTFCLFIVTSKETASLSQFW